MNTTATPYKTRGMVEVVQTRANFREFFPGRYLTGKSTQWVGSRPAIELMHVTASWFTSELCPPDDVELARTLVNSRELFKGENQ